MTRALDARVRRLEVRQRTRACAADEEAARESALQWLDKMLSVIPAPDWSQEDRWSKAERLAVRVQADPRLRGEAERWALEPGGTDFWRRILVIGERLTAAHAAGHL